MQSDRSAVTDASCPPRVAARAGGAEAGANGSAGARLRPKIMMVDDEKLNLYVVAEYLRASGYRELISTVDAREALQLAARTRPDAILLDIEMPHLNGLELLAQIRAHAALAETPVVFLTSLTDDEVKAKARELGAQGFLNKPVDRAELLELLNRLRDILAA